MRNISLNEKQKRFCEEYVKDYNGAQAAIRAGYSAKTARVIASEHLTKPNIQSYVQELQEELRKQSKAEVHVILEKLMQEATNYVDNPGSTRVQALGLLGKHLGMFTEKVEHSGDLEYNRIERVIVYRDEDGDLVEGDMATGTEKKIFSH